MTRILHLHVTFFYFEQIVFGDKEEEYRIVEKWRKAVEGKEYDILRIWRGYTSEAIDFPYRAPTIRTMTHEHFGAEPVTVYVFELESETKMSETIKYCPDCEAPTQGRSGPEPYALHTCETHGVLFDSQLDDWPGETHGKPAPGSETR